MAEPHPLPLPHCKGVAPTQAEVQLLSPACKTSLAGQSCPGSSRAEQLQPWLVPPRAGQPRAASCAGTARLLAVTSPRYKREGSCGWHLYGFGKHQLSGFGCLRGKTSRGAV